MGLFGSSNKKETPGTLASKRIKAREAVPDWRPVYLLYFPSVKFKAHWAMFVPEIQDRRCRKGKLIHVIGSVRDGFQLEFRRNYDINLTRNPPRPPVELGLAPTAFLIDTSGDGTYSRDCEPKDHFENLITSVPAPPKSLHTVQAGSVSSPLQHPSFVHIILKVLNSQGRPRLGVQNCLTVSGG